MIKKNINTLIIILSIIVLLIIALWDIWFCNELSESEELMTSVASIVLDERMEKLDSLYEIKELTLLKEELIQFRSEESQWSKNISDKKRAKVYEWLYYKYSDLEETKLARQYSKLGLNFIDSTKNKYFYANMLRNYALAESQLENYNKAIDIHFRALAFLASDTLNTSYSYITQNLGNNFRETNDLDLALKYYEKSEAVVKAVRTIDSIENFDEILGYIYANVGYVYSLQGKIKASNEKYTSSINYFEEHKLVSHKNIVKSVLASNYIEQDLLNKAENQLDGILAYASLNQDFELYAETSISLFKLNIKKGKVEQAFKIIKDAENNIGTSNSNRLVLKILDAKVDYFNKKQDYQKAFSLLERKINLQDSIYSATKNELQRELSVKYQTDLKNERIDQLEIINQKEKSIRQIYLAGITVLGGVVVLIVLLLRRINKQKKEVERANYTKDQLFSIIAHDLRSPILALQGMGDLIQYHIQKNNQNKLKQLGNESQLALSKINQLLQNLLDWSLTNKNQLSFNPENVKISDLIDENIKLFKNLLDIKKIELKIDLDEKTLLLDRNMMSSAIRNILSNAIKLSPEKSRLIITGKVEENFYLLSFKDEAGGISDEILKSIFQNKEQLVDGKTTQSVGLGMRLIQLFILKNKAKLDIKNTKKGTRISIRFPFTSIKS